MPLKTLPALARPDTRDDPALIEPEAPSPEGQVARRTAEGQQRALPAHFRRRGSVARAGGAPPASPTMPCVRRRSRRRAPGREPSSRVLYARSGPVEPPRPAVVRVAAVRSGPRSAPAGFALRLDDPILVVARVGPIDHADVIGRGESVCKDRVRLGHGGIWSPDPVLEVRSRVRPVDVLHQVVVAEPRIWRLGPLVPGLEGETRAVRPL